MSKLIRKLKNKKGFTLVEMLIVVAIIAILIAVSIPVVSGALEKARDATDQANERAAKAAALLYYLDAVDDTLTIDGSPYKPGTAIAADKVWYNAETGKLTTTEPEAYGQCQGNADCYRGDSDSHVGDAIMVEIKDDGEVALTWK